MKSGKKFQNKIKKINLGIIGCGSVCEMYLDYLSSRTEVCLFSCSDINFELSRNIASKYGIKKILTVAEMLADKDVDIVLNLTNPLSHFKINYDVLKSKKHLFCEKPYAINSKDAGIILGLAKKNRLLFYTAPDTYLSDAYKSAKDFMDGGGIGNVFSVNIISTCRSVEIWHPNPDFFYQKGAGPLFDRGVYYLTALVFLFGKIKSVGCYSDNYIANRIYKKGLLTREISIESRTHYSVIIKFQSGITATLMISFDTAPNPENTDVMTIYGSNGVINIPTPMEYDGDARIYDSNSMKWKNIKEKRNAGYYLKGDVRGVSIIEMIDELRNCRLNYDNATIASHIIVVMEAIEKAGKSNKIINIK